MRIPPKEEAHLSCHDQTFWSCYNKAFLPGELLEGVQWYPKPTSSPPDSQPPACQPPGRIAVPSHTGEGPRDCRMLLNITGVWQHRRTRAFDLRWDGKRHLPDTKSTPFPNFTFPLQRPGARGSRARPPGERGDTPQALQEPLLHNSRAGVLLQEMARHSLPTV